jgi:hypothetical protein
MGANDVHGEPIATMTLPKCYKATVNETETITEAQPFCRVRSRSGPVNLRALGLRIPATSHVERS